MGFGCLCPLEPPLFSIDKNIIVVDMLIGVFQFNMASSLAQWFERAINWRGVGVGVAVGVAVGVWVALIEGGYVFNEGATCSISACSRYVRDNQMSI